MIKQKILFKNSYRRLFITLLNCSKGCFKSLFNLHFVWFYIVCFCFKVHLNAQTLSLTAQTNSSCIFQYEYSFYACSFIFFFPKKYSYEYAILVFFQSLSQDGKQKKDNEILKKENRNRQFLENLLMCFLSFFK